MTVPEGRISYGKRRRKRQFGQQLARLAYSTYQFGKRKKATDRQHSEAQQQCKAFRKQRQAFKQQRKAVRQQRQAIRHYTGKALRDDTEAAIVFQAVDQYSQAVKLHDKPETAEQLKAIVRVYAEYFKTGHRPARPETVIRLQPAESEAVIRLQSAKSKAGLPSDNAKAVDRPLRSRAAAEESQAGPCRRRCGMRRKPDRYDRHHDHADRLYHHVY